ncbi:CFI-box-CTERM domain-containing protein [Cellulosimicrobium sp. NPDC055967]|uniref:CFI-box-CTERM domain-containing protein n=1 Tax=Cellulosimicrobium sp. NPDC055967 TaxID=3345670 RepID=UPI0035DEE326
MATDFNDFYGEMRMCTMRLRRAERDPSMTPAEIRDYEKQALDQIDGFTGDWLHYADGYAVATNTESEFLRDHNKAMVKLLTVDALQRPGAQEMTRDEFTRRLRELKELLTRLDRTMPPRIATYMGSYASNIAHVDEELSSLPTSTGRALATSSGQSKGSGCYVATAVYGTYDCEPLWTLRRYRDERLALTMSGRAFIRIYYALSPTFVRTLARFRGVQVPIRAVLDRWVVRLQDRGFEGRPYADPTNVTSR